MNPSQLAHSIKIIASGIEASKKPNKELVIRDLKKILAQTNDEESINDINLVKPISAEVRNYEEFPDGSSYAVIDGKFKFKLPGGQICEFDGRLDQNSQNGKFICDGEDMTEALWNNSYDTADFSWLDPTLDPGYINLDTVLEMMAKNN